MEEADRQNVIGAIHDFVIYPIGAVGASPTVDAEGRVTQGEVDPIEVRGSVDELSAREIQLAAQRGETHDIACRAPLDTEVSDRDEVGVTIPVRLAGRYKVDAIRATRSHLRLLCSKTTIRD